jgi:hypothetical protein
MFEKEVNWRLLEIRLLVNPLDVTESFSFFPEKYVIAKRIAGDRQLCMDRCIGVLYQTDS